MTILMLFSRAPRPPRTRATPWLRNRLYRRLMKVDPADPAAPFNLGNLLRSFGRIVEVEAIYREATKADPSFAEAWYNLAPDACGACVSQKVFKAYAKIPSGKDGFGPRLNS
jgi:predicted Zn-dependent protease